MDVRPPSSYSRPLSGKEAWSEMSTSPSPLPLTVTENRRLERPKSTPSGLKVTFSDKPKAPLRPRTAIGLGTSYNNTGGVCERVKQVEQEVRRPPEPTRRHSLGSHLPTKKSRPRPWQKGLDGPLSTYYNGPGYILHKGKNKFAMTIKMEEFWDRPEEDPKISVKSKGVQHDPIMKQLQDQIEELSLFLEEERLNHKETKRKATEELDKKVKNLTAEADRTLSKMNEEQSAEIEAMKDEYESELTKLKKEANQTIGKMKGEIEFLHGSFESFKTALASETNSKWKKKEQDFIKRNTDNLEKQLHDLKVKMMQDKSAEKASMIKEHNKEIKVLQRDSQKEMEALTRRYSNAIEIEENLNDTQSQLHKTTKELESLKTLHKTVDQQLKNTAADLTDTKMRLSEFEEKFAEKVKEVDDKYQGQIHDLMEQNTEIRRMYMKKCSELIQEKTITDRNITDRVNSAKDTMKVLINTRHRAKISMAAIEPNADQSRLLKIRPSSAPGTRGELRHAHQSAGETEHLNKPPDPPIMPDNVTQLLARESAHAKAERLNEELGQGQDTREDKVKALSFEDLLEAVDGVQK